MKMSMMLNLKFRNWWTLFIFSFVFQLCLTPGELKAEFNASVFTGTCEVTDLCGKTV